MTDEERKKRIHDITYSTDDREELAERIVKLEELCADFYRCMSHSGTCCVCRAVGIEHKCLDRMDELGVPR